MTGHDSGWPYWSVDLPGLNCKQAYELLGMAARARMSVLGTSFLGTAVDPAAFLALNLDRSSVESLLRALSAVPPGWEPPDASDLRSVAGIREVMQQWLAAASSE
jgi:hypothetical protein